MTTTLQQHQSADRPLTAVLDAVPAGGWEAPSPCEGWTARDVVAHLVDTQRELFATHGVDLGEAPDLSADPAAAWREHARRVAAALADPSVPAIAYDGWFGPTTLGATLEQFYVWDMLVHRWDVARAVGAGSTGGTFSEAELDRVEGGADGFGEAIHGEGVCRPGVEAPVGAPREVRVLARLGRTA
ncbi:maleylpyruvate isomerase family mycothiol-dependent enzyme [uncultured Pseudokineococcus sp.]|uniref:maleylpyruvate isomerase family mycothiol-dependent enzyme n=1 Tax=uncultured Pseudokineococcus sp. TaxID=1642928 RepID=UPI00260632D2|nr:maleylpyruvate isomerase family mycothiol-dependent enzyme [uncultured Pseudokineococcus sp.]